MKANPVGWFEIPVSDIERAKTFYESVFECELAVTEMAGSQMAWFPFDEEAIGSSGSLIQGEGYEPANVGSIVYLTAPDIDAHVARIEASGGKMILPKTSIGEHGWIAHFEDSEGNRVALHSRLD